MKQGFVNEDGLRTVFDTIKEWIDGKPLVMSPSVEVTDIPDGKYLAVGDGKIVGMDIPELIQVSNEAEAIALSVENPQNIYFVAALE